MIDVKEQLHKINDASRVRCFSKITSKLTDKLDTYIFRHMWDSMTHVDTTHDFIRKELDENDKHAVIFFP